MTSVRYSWHEANYGTANNAPVPDSRISADAQSVRFTEMDAEAERELAEWDAILHGDA